ncbi:hypothetical protein GGI02_005344, partial [Coemansia sp. RSA 2322]
MNQNPFAFFAADANGYPQLPDPLGQNPYLDARTGGLVIKDDSMHTSTMSQDSHETDSDPSSPSKSNKKSDRRAPKSKAEVSERMRRWRTENAEKNRLNDLRCRVYRQARIRFGKDPTPEREAWIQSEIFRRLERRRLREVMKGGNGSIPAPTSMGSPTSIEMGFGSSHHPAAGAITRSRSTVHPFPMHVSGAPGAGSEHAMGFSASSYAMMAGNSVYDPSQHHAHQPSQHPHYADSGAAYHSHPPPSHHAHAHASHQQQHIQQQHGNYLSQSQGYAHQQQHGHPHHQQQQQHHGEHQLAHNFMAGASGALPSADIYGGFKFISPLYQGRLLPTQPVEATHPAAQSLYASQPPSYMHPQQQQQPPQQPQQSQQHHHHPQQHHHHQSQGGLPPHSVPSHQPSHMPSSRDPASAAAAAAAAAAAVADLSSSFQLPQASSQSLYPYYQDSVPTWEAPASSAEMSNGQSHSSPSTPTETIGFHQPQYSIHAVDSQPAYSVLSSSNAPAANRSPPPTSAATPSPMPAPSSTITSLSMVSSIATGTMSGQPQQLRALPSSLSDGIVQQSKSASGVAESDFSSMAAAVAAAAANAPPSNR